MSLLQALLVLGALGAAAGCVLGWRRWSEQHRETLRVRATFSRYVAPAVVDVLLARKDERMFTGRKVRATILVCRIRDFAHFVEPLSPEEALRYLNEFYALSGTAIQRRRGIIDSFLGDGIVAVFGVPLDNPTQEDDALQAALDIVRHVVAMRARWEKQHRKAFTIGIGINTGEVIAGDAGFRDRREFTVVGSEASYAYRLQEAAFSLNAFIVASRATCQFIANEYKLVPLQGVPLPGVRRLLDAYVVRARVRGQEAFTVPDDAMVRTTIESPEAPSATAAPAAAPPPAPKSAPSPQPATAAKTPAAEPPLARPRARPRTMAGATSVEPAPDIALPSLEPGWTPLHDGPVFPDPPPPRATYEDRGGSVDL
jgi:class 3 adenylate cyclase